MGSDSQHFDIGLRMDRYGNLVMMKAGMMTESLYREMYEQPTLDELLDKHKCESTKRVRLSRKEIARVQREEPDKCQTLQMPEWTGEKVRLEWRGYQIVERQPIQGTREPKPPQVATPVDQFGLTPVRTEQEFREAVKDTNWQPMQLGVAKVWIHKQQIMAMRVPTGNFTYHALWLNSQNVEQPKPVVDDKTDIQKFECDLLKLCGIDDKRKINEMIVRIAVGEVPTFKVEEQLADNVGTYTMSRTYKFAEDEYEQQVVAKDRDPNTIRSLIEESFKNSFANEHDPYVETDHNIACELIDVTPGLEPHDMDEVLRCIGVLRSQYERNRPVVTLADVIDPQVYKGLDNPPIAFTTNVAADLELEETDHWLKVQCPKLNKVCSETGTLFQLKDDRLVEITKAGKVICDITLASVDHYNTDILVRMVKNALPEKATGQPPIQVPNPPMAVSEPDDLADVFESCANENRDKVIINPAIWERIQAEEPESLEKRPIEGAMPWNLQRYNWYWCGALVEVQVNE